MFPQEQGSDPGREATRPKNSGVEIFTTPLAAPHLSCSLNNTSPHQITEMSAVNQINPSPEVEIRKKSIFSKLGIALESPAVQAGIGSSIVSCMQSRFGFPIMVVATLLSAANSMREHSNLKTNLSRKLSDGIKGLADYALSSPGAFCFVQAAGYLVAATENLAKGEKIFAAIYSTFAVGSLAAAAINNCEYHPIRGTISMLERAGNKIWSLIPPGTKSVLSNPGFAFPLGNLSLSLLTMNFDKLHQNPVATGIFWFGATGLTMGIVRGARPFFSSKRTPNSWLSPIAGGCGDIILGVGNILGSNIQVGAALISWGISNINLGLKIRGSTKSEALLPEIP